MLKDSIMKSTKNYKSGGGRKEEWAYNGGGELVQSTLYTCMEIAQLNPLILLMCANSKDKTIF
jgi:hypothetical protein